MSNESTNENTLDPSMVQMLETIEASAVAVRAKVLADFEAGVKAALAKKLAPNMDTVRAISEPAPVKTPALGTLRISDPRQHLYERMKIRDPELACYRSPDADHWSGEWIRAMSVGDHKRASEATDKITEIFGRATLTESTTTAVSGLSQGESGFLIPLPLAGSIAIALNRSAKIRSLSSVYQSVAKTLRIPTSATATALMKLEGAVAAQGEPDLSSVLLDKKKMQAQFGASKETLRDSAFDLSSFFAERAGSAFGQLEDVEICTAASTPTVTESIVAGVTDFAEGLSGTLTYKDLIEFWYTIPEQYQANATWLMGGVSAGLLSRLAMSFGSGATLSGVGPLLSPVGPSVTIGDGANVQGFVFGRPVVIVPLASGTIYCGDVRRQYGILDDGGIEVESSMHAGWTTDTVLWKFTRRVDGAGLVNDAARKMLGLTTIA